MTGSWNLRFDGGSLLLEWPGRHRSEHTLPPDMPSALVWDDRVQGYRAKGYHYRTVRAWLHRNTPDYQDLATRYQTLALTPSMQRTPRDYQKEAIESWKSFGKRGLILLPTGTGKSFVAEMAMIETQRSTLVLAPTIDLMNQWYDILTSAFQCPVGLLGGGYHEIEDITVSTYDSAYLYMDRYGNRFGLTIFDEVHHLPGSSYRHAAECCIAPFRLGLTATLERPDGLHTLLDDMVGPIVYHRSIRDMAGEYLASYDTESIIVELTPQEKQEYQDARELYRSFVREKGISLGSPQGWNLFIQTSSRSSAGRRAMKAFQQARRIALSAPSKIQHLEGLLRQHAADRTILFTNDNATVYLISRRFLIPAITHQTDAKERKELLQRFNNGTYPCLVTSRVLNEGVNIPEANVAIILSGTGSVREHVQRLGRILRPGPNKRAILYEMITADTIEKYVSERRREHDAYRREEEPTEADIGFFDHDPDSSN